MGDQAGGPLYPIELGRRDSLTSFAENSETYLPPFSLNVSGLLANFEAAGLNLVDLVVLSGKYILCHDLVRVFLISHTHIKKSKWFCSISKLMLAACCIWIETTRNFGNYHMKKHVVKNWTEPEGWTSKTWRPRGPSHRFCPLHYMLPHVENSSKAPC